MNKNLNNFIASSSVSEGKSEVLTVYSGEVTKEIFDQLFEFCRQAEQETRHEQHLNMRTQCWESDQRSLLYLLMTEQRFKRSNGGLCLLREDGKVTAVSGFYRSDLHADIWVMGVRSWVLKGERFQLKVARCLLPKHLEEMKALGAKMAIITFNEETRPFQLLIQHANDSLVRGAKVLRFFGPVENYPEIYHDMWARPSPVWIKKTKQWLLVKRLDPNFVYDFFTAD